MSRKEHFVKGGWGSGIWGSEVQGLGFRGFGFNGGFRAKGFELMAWGCGFLHRVQCLGPGPLET